MSDFSSPSPLFSNIVSGTAKLNEVTNILNSLSDDLRNSKMSPNQRDAHLERLKIYSRDPSNSEPIYTNDGIGILTEIAFKNPSPTTSRNALRCLANAMLLKSETRQLFVDSGFLEDACNKLRNGNIDDEFLMSRIIFLTTYDTNIDLEAFINKNHLAEIICHNISEHANHFESGIEQNVMEPIEEMAMIETLKLMFNLTHFCPQKISVFSPSLKYLILILTRWPITSKGCHDPPIASLINAIINLDLSADLITLFPPSNPNFFVDHCVKLLDDSTQNHGEDELEQGVTPLIVLLRKVNDLASPETQVHLQNLLLPSMKDRQQALGRSKSLSSRLLNLSSNSLAPQLRESISALLFELSDREPKKFIQNIGYGFASGFLCNHNLPISTEYLESSTNNRDDDEENLSTKVNPVTGQLLEKEQDVKLENMTEEEKEREAERLFVLFERLEKNGIISVKNPAKNIENLVDADSH